MNHTPTPWAVEYVYGGKATMVYARLYEVGRKSHSVGFAGVYKCPTKEEAIANANFIVRACNAHDALVKALAEMVQVHLRPSGPSTGNIVNDERREACEQAAMSALKLARGE